METYTLPTKISENEDFVKWIEVYTHMEKDHPQRTDLRRVLVKEWFDKVGPTAVETWCFYFYDKEKDEIIDMGFVQIGI